MDAKFNRDEIRKIYKKYAPTYDIWSGITESKARQCCLEKSQIKDGESVLEVAVGTGILFEKVLQINPHGKNVGIDLSEAMLSRARERAKKSGISSYILEVGDAYNLPYQNNSFDVILNNYMFDLIPERDFVAILVEFKRVLRKGGRIAIVNMTRGGRGFNTVWDSLYRISPALLGGCRGIELKPYLEAAGFKGVERKYMSQVFFPSEIIFAVKP